MYLIDQLSSRGGTVLWYPFFIAVTKILHKTDQLFLVAVRTFGCFGNMNYYQRIDIAFFYLQRLHFCV
ncbi:MAG: hypothetical protein D3915_07465 [Candidatus Electrothrix sp. AU1_5]|nr:hypothetical protein [Candidatus Electrothrix gigas]MCI5225791.1 hypothetical protein [Candidatus Electrothrix gigas]